MVWNICGFSFPIHNEIDEMRYRGSFDVSEKFRRLFFFYSNMWYWIIEYSYIELTVFSNITSKLKCVILLTTINWKSIALSIIDFRVSVKFEVIFLCPVLHLSNKNVVIMMSRLCQRYVIWSWLSVLYCSRNERKLLSLQNFIWQAYVSPKDTFIAFVWSNLPLVH